MNTIKVNINMTNNCDKSQITQKNRQTCDFSQFSQCLLNRQLALDFSDYYNITKNWEKSSDLRFFATHQKSQFLLLRANRVAWISSGYFESLLLPQLLRGENDSKQSDEFQATNRVDISEKEWKLFKPSAPNSGRLQEVPIVRLRLGMKFWKFWRFEY